MTSKCMICYSDKDTRHINLHIMGSEGLDICHDCEMRLVSIIRHMMSLSTTGRKIGYKHGKKMTEIQFNSKGNLSQYQRG